MEDSSSRQSEYAVPPGTTYHVSCLSDRFDGSDMVGMVIFKHNGRTDFHLNGHDIKSGYILIKKYIIIKNDSCTSGQVHGKLYHWFFNENPKACQGVVVEGFGFAYHEGKWKFKSCTLNTVLGSVVPDLIAEKLRHTIECYWMGGTDGLSNDRVYRNAPPGTLYHVSDESDGFDGTDMAGMCMMEHNGKTEFDLNGRHIRKGFILIKRTSNIINDPCTFGQVHGKLYHWFFKENRTAFAIGFGFAYHKGEWKFTSRTLNEVLNNEVPEPIAEKIRLAIDTYWKTGQQNTYAYNTLHGARKKPSKCVLL